MLSQQSQLSDMCGEEDFNVFFQLSNNNIQQLQHQMRALQEELIQTSLQIRNQQNHQWAIENLQENMVPTEAPLEQQ